MSKTVTIEFELPETCNPKCRFCTWDKHGAYCVLFNKSNENHTGTPCPACIEARKKQQAEKGKG